MILTEEDFDTTEEVTAELDFLETQMANEGTTEDSGKDWTDVVEAGPRKRKREEEGQKDNKRQKIVRVSEEAKEVDLNISRILKAHGCRLALEKLTEKLEANIWKPFTEKHEDTDLQGALKLFGSKYTFELRSGKTIVLLNLPRNGPPMGVFPPMPPPWMGMGWGFPPGPYGRGAPPFPGRGRGYGGPFPGFGGLKRPSRTVVSCDICQMDFNSQKVLESHLQGKKHKKKVSMTQGETAPAVATKAPAKASPTPAKANPAPAKAAAPTQPAAKKEDGAPAVKFNSKGEVQFKQPTPHPAIFYQYECMLCKVPINSKKAEEMHLGGKKHKRAVKAATAPRLATKVPAVKPQPKPKVSGPAVGKKENPFQKYMCNYCNIEITSAKMEAAHVAGKRHLKKVKLAGQSGNAPQAYQYQNLAGVSSVKRSVFTEFDYPPKAPKRPKHSNIW